METTGTVFCLLASKHKSWSSSRRNIGFAWDCCGVHKEKLGETADVPVMSQGLPKFDLTSPNIGVLHFHTFLVPRFLL